MVTEGWGKDLGISEYTLLKLRELEVNTLVDYSWRINVIEKNNLCHTLTFKIWEKEKGSEN